MRAGEGAGRSLGGNDRGTADERAESTPIIARPTFRCDACGRPTGRWQAICRPCLATHYRLDGLIRAQEILHACGGAAVIPAVVDVAAGAL